MQEGASVRAGVTEREVRKSHFRSEVLNDPTAGRTKKRGAAVKEKKVI